MPSRQHSPGSLRLPRAGASSTAMPAATNRAAVTTVRTTMTTAHSKHIFLFPSPTKTDGSLLRPPNPPSIHTCIHVCACMQHAHLRIYMRPVVVDLHHVLPLSLCLSLSRSLHPSPCAKEIRLVFPPSHTHTFFLPFPTGDCHDKPGVLHFAGTIATAEACEATCTGAPADGCSVWLWSTTSKHCWWRTDNVFTDMKKSGTGVISGCRSVASGKAKCVPGCGGCNVPPTPPPPPPAPFKPSKADNMNGESSGRKGGGEEKKKNNKLLTPSIPYACTRVLTCAALHIRHSRSCTGQYILSNTPKSNGFTLNKFSDYPGGVEYVLVLRPTALMKLIDDSYPLRCLLTRGH